jgi:hypothetical protein
MKNLIFVIPTARPQIKSEVSRFPRRPLRGRRGDDEMGGVPRVARGDAGDPGQVTSLSRVVW